MATKKTATKKTATKKTAEGMVTCRVLPLGDGKLSTGKREASADVKFAKGDTFEHPEALAKNLEAKGWVEIVESDD